MKTVRQKIKDGEITWVDYYNDLAKKKGFKNRVDYRNAQVRKHGFRDYKDYMDDLAKRNGFEDYKGYINNYNHVTGRKTSMYENEDCASYLGIYICEEQIAKKYLSMVFRKVEKMPNGNSGFDYFCDDIFKVDVKGACISERVSYSNIYDEWSIRIDKNKIADYFLIIAIDNRVNKNIGHVWLIRGDEFVSGSILNCKQTFDILNTFKILNKLEKYEDGDKLEKLKDWFNTINSNHKE